MVDALLCELSDTQAARFYTYIYYSLKIYGVSECCQDHHDNFTKGGFGPYPFCPLILYNPMQGEEENLKVTYPPCVVTYTSGLPPGMTRATTEVHHFFF